MVLWERARVEGERLLLQLERLLVPAEVAEGRGLVKTRASRVSIIAASASFQQAANRHDGPSPGQTPTAKQEGCWRTNGVSTPALRGVVSRTRLTRDNLIL